MKMRGLNVSGQPAHNHQINKDNPLRGLPIITGVMYLETLRIAHMIKFRELFFHTIALFAFGSLGGVSLAQPDPLVFQSVDGQFKYVLHNGLTPNDVELSTSVLEEYCERVLSDLNVESVPQTTVTIWNDSESYYLAQEETTGQRFEGSGGYAWWGEIPELRLRHSTWKEADIGALHEYAHIVTMVRNKSIPNNPRWLWEAIAIYATRDIQSREPEIPGFISDRDFPSLNELNIGFNSADERRNIYDIGYFLGDYIVLNWGIEALGDLAESNGNIPDTLKISIAEFEQGWQKYFEENYLN